MLGRRKHLMITKTQVIAFYVARLVGSYTEQVEIGDCASSFSPGEVVMKPSGLRLLRAKQNDIFGKRVSFFQRNLVC